ncbi:GNAT family N-acetyltransferase [Xanthomarina sp. F1114]|uniref:GNAT family N-acetyltransferase n=1 Tax=Xanthomarina sp. F1114 TaxID=2996019 RepID=UPI00225DF47A|nr:GNAT family N-acetyltransferase [Xanthomarina sp. F1114]MCX7547265.1 GNAT family N-acetyltransferase [Xanthomarina sp. F1114]
MKILKSTLEDINDIFKLYDDATSYQKKVNNKSWRGFSRSLVEQEIDENRHFKIIEGKELACTFLIAFKNPVIWEDAGHDNAIYLHRIATNSNFRGQGYVKKIVAWTIQYAKEKNIDFVRLDTHSGNEKINTYYKSCGFTYKGIKSIEWTSDLPEHYKDGPFSLFEIAL